MRLLQITVVQEFRNTMSRGNEVCSWQKASLIERPSEQQGRSGASATYLQKRTGIMPAAYSWHIKQTNQQQRAGAEELADAGTRKENPTRLLLHMTSISLPTRTSVMLEPIVCHLSY